MPDWIDWRFLAVWLAATPAISIFLGALVHRGKRHVAEPDDETSDFPVCAHGTLPDNAFDGGA